MAGPDIRPGTAPRVRAIRNGRRACGRNIRARTALLLLLLAIAAAAWPSGAEAAASAPAAWPALLPAGLPGDGPATSVRLVDDAAGFSTGMPHEAAGFPAAGPTDDAAALPPEAERLEAHWTAIMNEYGDYFAPGARPPFRELVAPDGGSPKTADVLAGLMRFFFHDIVRHGRLLVSIVVLTVLSSVLQTLQGAFERQAVSRVAYGICYLVILIMAVDSFRTAISYAGQAIGRMIDLMTAAVPLLLVLLASIGNLASVTVLHPLIVFMVNVVGHAVHAVVFPLLFFSAILHIVSSMSEKYKVSQLADLLRTIGTGILGVLLTAFLGVLSVQGVAASVADGVTIRTAKYITGNFVPVVGKMFTDAADAVIGTSLLVKNAVGMAGLLMLALLCAFPAVKILSLAIIFNLSGAVMQPLGDSPIVACLRMIGRSLVDVFAALAAIGLMFFFAMTILITSGNIAMMVR
jgi:stage III sporulation protein AE